MDKLFIFSLCFYFCLAKITIKHLNVPPSISVSEEEVILDCEFDDQEGEVDEVKWFFDGLVKQIYQWLPKRNMKPQALGSFKDNIDISYKATKNTTTMYRALRITNLSPELSGNYTCKVSGPHSEDFKTKRMIIYDPADYDLALNVTGDDDELTIECSAEGIFPKPEMTLLIAHYNESNVIIEDETEITEFNDQDDSYNIESNITIDLDNLISPVYYTCKLNIPGTDYNLNISGLHYFESGTDTQSEEDNLNILNSTNSMETTLKESQEIETQIEENSENATSTADSKADNIDDNDNDDDNDSVNDNNDNNDDNDDDDDDSDEHDDNEKENDSIRHLPSLSLLTTLLLTMLSASYA